MFKSKKQQGELLLLPDKQAVPFYNEESILEILINNKIEINHSCGGMGSCGTCQVKVHTSDLEPRNQIEEDMAQMRSFNEDQRLACQLQPVDKIKIEIPT